MKSKYLICWLLGMLLLSSQAEATPLRWKDALIAQGMQRLEEQLLQNERNRQAGQTHLNQYIITLDDLVSEGDCLEERGNPQSNYRILQSSQLQTLEALMAGFHATHSKQKQMGFYVFVINDWKLRLAKKVPKDFAISTLDDLRTFARQQEQQEIDQMYADLSTVPGAILDRLQQRGYTQLTYVYLYAQLRAYDVDGAATNNVNNAVVKKKVFVSQVLNGNAQAQQESTKPAIWDVATLLSKGHTTHYDRLQANIHRFTETYAAARTVANRAEEATALGINQVPGRDLYVNLPATKNLTGDAYAKFVELCKYLNSKAGTQSFAFWHTGISENSIRQQGGEVLHSDVIAHLVTSNILTVETFTNQFTERSSRDFEVLWMQKSDDLTADIPLNYNQHSKDYVNDGVYRYSLRDLLSRREQKNLNSIFWQYIKVAEAGGNAEAICREDGVEQYVGLYDTYSALFHWMKNYFIEVAEPASITSAVRTIAKFKVIKPIRKTDAQIVKELDVFKAKNDLKKLEKAYESLQPEVKLKVTKLGNLEGMAVAGDEASDNIILLAAKGNDEMVEIGRVANGDIVPTIYVEGGTPIGEAIDGLRILKTETGIGFYKVVSKYPIEGFRDMALKWSGEKAYRFKKADMFYQNNKPADTYISQIDDELRAIDFDKPVLDGTFKKGDYVYQWVYPKRGTIDEFDINNVGS
jgi:hypothetical protein